MRLTIIVPDKAINIDGVYLNRIQQDLSWIPSNVHAVQWYDTWGEIEYTDQDNNQKITDLGIFEQAIEDHKNEIQRLKDEENRKESERDYWKEFRRRRNALLADSDWTQSRDVLLDNDQEWKDYRQTLRDLSDNIDDPKFLVLDPNHSDWPTPPS